MGQLIRSLVKNSTPQLERQLGILVAFFVSEGSIWYLESKNIPISAHLPFRPGAVLLFAASVGHGISRVVGFHPIWQPGYRIWLESTPWTHRKPLPLGGVDLRWEDLLILASFILLSALLPKPRAMSLLCAFLLGHLFALTATLWLTRVRTIGYFTAGGLGLAVWLWPQPIACLVASTVVYLIAYEGVWRGLEQFPWKPRKFVRLNTDLTNLSWHEEPCGWPYDRIMRETLINRGISRIDAVLCCVIAIWWLFVLTSFIADPLGRLGFLTVTFLFLVMICFCARLFLYIQGYQSPITIWGRIWTFRWIIPSYDRVFLAPICTILAGLSTFAVLQAGDVPRDVCAIVATGVTAMTALLSPPRLRKWRLTGQHRMVNTSGQNNTAFVKVG
jgi:hypothetical protein